MTHPRDYRANYTPEDCNYLELLHQKYGTRFQKINKQEKLYLITAVASHLCCTATGETRSEIHALGQEIPTQLSVYDQEGLISALINQVRWDSRPAISDVSLLEQENNPF